MKKLILKKKNITEYIRSFLIIIVNYPSANKSIFGFSGRKLIGYLFNKISNPIKRKNKNYPELRNKDLKVLNELKSNGFYKSISSDCQKYEVIINKSLEISNLSENFLKGKNIYTNKNFMYDALKILNQEIPKELIEFGKRNEYTNTIINYLGDEPRLISVKILVSNPQESKSRNKSQLFHFDDQSEKMIKLIIPIKKVFPDSGPFTFIPKRESRLIAKKLNYGFPFKDSNIKFKLEKKLMLNNFQKEFIGDPKFNLLIDTSKCLHKGSIDVKKQRVILMFSYNGGQRTTLIKEPVSINI